MTYKTYNIELIMSDTTRSHWMNLLAQTRDAFNMCAQLVTSNDIRLQLVPVHQTCYDTLRKQFPDIPSQGIIRVQKNVLAMLRAIKANKHDSVPSKKSLSLQLDKRLYSNLTKEGISLSNGKRGHREKCTFRLYDKVRELFDNCTTADPTIFARDGRLFLAVPFEIPSLPCNDDNSIGVDLGMKRLFVTSEGEILHRQGIPQTEEETALSQALSPIQRHTFGETPPPQGKEKGTQPDERYGREGDRHTAWQYEGERPRLGRPDENKGSYLKNF